MDMTMADPSRWSWPAMMLHSHNWATAQLIQSVTATGLLQLAEAGCHEQSIIKDEKSKCSCLMCGLFIPNSKVGPEGIQSDHHLESTTHRLMEADATLKGPCPSQPCYHLSRRECLISLDTKRPAFTRLALLV